MSPEEKQHLVAGFIEHNRRQHVWGSDTVLREVKGQDNLWAVEALDDLCRKDAELAWELILQILHTPHDDYATTMLAAGPMEELLGHFGTQLIARVEDRAKSDPEFKDLLGGVWQGAMSKDIWHRVEACRGEPW